MCIYLHFFSIYKYCHEKNHKYRRDNNYQFWIRMSYVLALASLFQVYLHSSICTTINLSYRKDLCGTYLQKSLTFTYQSLITKSYSSVPRMITLLS